MKTWCLLAVCGALFAQDNFEVASVRRSPLPTAGPIVTTMHGGPGSADPRQIDYANVTLRDVLTTAYDLKTFQIAGPVWLDTEHYDVVAKIPAGATNEQFHRMLQGLLTERFKMRLHRDSKRVSGFDLIVGKTGSKLRQAQVDPNQPVSTGSAAQTVKMDKNGFPELKDAGMMTWTSKKNGVVQVRTSAKQQPLSELAGMLEQNLSAPVMDRTGLNGRYDFTLAYSVEGGGASPESLATLAQAGAWFPRGPLEVPILSDALQEQLGLTLEKTKVAVELLVIDSAEKAPSKH